MTDRTAIRPWDEADRKLRHQILRKLERADWADQEDDPQDAAKAISAACRLALKLHDQPDGLPTILGRAMTAAIEQYGGVETVGRTVSDAAKILIKEGEDYRGCDYGM